MWNWAAVLPTGAHSRRSARNSVGKTPVSRQDAGRSTNLPECRERANEELETTEEELQSVNEELTSVNGELALRVQEVGRANSDLKTLLESTQIALVERSIAYELEGKQPWGSTKGACIARSSCH
jgi:uncharacterized protein (DUF3084 family)